MKFLFRLFMSAGMLITVTACGDGISRPISFLAMFIVTRAGFVQAEGLVDYAGLFQRITLTIGWVWLTLLPIFLLKDPRRR